MKNSKYSLGLDFGTNSVRALLVNLADGREVATAVHNYETGEAGIILSGSDPNLARQNPADYIRGTEAVTKAVLRKAKAVKGFSPWAVVGIGIDTTGSTPIPVDRSGTAPYME